ncbi:MAG: alanine racemase [Lachnospiraceae bacterium]|nr:alanine racemase [Lachnospiraceae bacterium]
MISKITDINQVDKYWRLYADIDLDAIRYNISSLQKKIAENSLICAVIKADGYGHGAIPIARNISDLVDYYAVATLGEAVSLATGIEEEKPILILGYTHHKTVELLDNTGSIRFTVFDYETAKRYSDIALKSGSTIKIHIKIDTGMSRIGFFDNEDSVREIKRISRLKGVEIEGIFTHFFGADEADRTSAMKPLARFVEFCDKLEENGINIPIKHCSNSAASTVLPAANMDMVRLGVSIYGMYPSDDVHQVKLKPAMSLKSHVVMVKTIEKGTSIGYGGTFTADKAMKIATIPAGYADGYMRSLSNKGYVLIKGQKAPIVGRICMDQFMVDVSEIENVRRGDEVVLIGRQKGAVITIEEIANLAGSFNYEFACDISKRVPRRFYRDKKIILVQDHFLEHID